MFSINRRNYGSIIKGEGEMNRYVLSVSRCMALAIAGVLFIGSQAMADETDPGLNPYFFVGPCDTNRGCVLVTPPVPAGRRLVIQRVSVVGAVSNPATATGVPGTGTGVRADVGIQLASGPAGVQVSITDHPLSADGRSFAFDQPVLGYADAGSTAFVHIFTTQVLPTSGAINSISEALITVTGHLIDCTQITMAPGKPMSVCAPIGP